MASYLGSAPRPPRSSRSHLPGAAHDFGRRTRKPRRRDPVPHSARRVGSRRRRDSRDAHRGGDGARQGHLLRHGRDDRQDLSHQRLHAADRARVRGRPRGAFPEGQRHSVAHPGHRDGGGRGGRRFHRQDGRHGSDCSGPGQCRRRPRPCRLRARWQGAPTITDADIVLGRIDPRRFAGGKIALDVDAARRASGRRHRRHPHPARRARAAPCRRASGAARRDSISAFPAAAPARRIRSCWAARASRRPACATRSSRWSPGPSCGAIRTASTRSGA